MKRHFLDKTIRARRLAIQSFSTSTGEEPAEQNVTDRLECEHVVIGSFSDGDVRARVILSLSGDTALDHSLRTAALERGQVIIRVVSIDAALRMVRANCCGAALLDLDLAGRIGWETADCLLQEPKCPPVILLTGQREPHELKMAVQAGAIADKAAGAGKLLRLIDNAMEASHSARVERNAAQRVILRWLSPYRWTVSHTAKHRFWGINE